jgi:3-hydroxybutyryl-CoA dehydratase
MNPGDALPTRVVTVTAPPMRDVAKILRDPNPIHLDPLAAAAAGFGDRVINQGPSNLAYVIDMLIDAFPGHRLRSIESRYLGSVRDGDVVEAGGEVRTATDDEVICDAWLKIRGSGTALSVAATLKRR